MKEKSKSRPNKNVNDHKWKVKILNSKQAWIKQEKSLDNAVKKSVLNSCFNLAEQYRDCKK